MMMVMIMFVIVIVIMVMMATVAVTVIMIIVKYLYCGMEDFIFVLCDIRNLRHCILGIASFDMCTHG